MTKKTVRKSGRGKKFIYFFGGGRAEGNGTMKDTLGGKGAGLAEMSNVGVPVPPGFTITTDVCNYYYASQLKVPAGLDVEMKLYIKKIEEIMGAGFGDLHNPLLVSVRSGAKFSMPGMMDTILNLGLNADTVQGLIEKTKNERFANDCYRRFIQMFGSVVLGIEKKDFEEVIEEKKEHLKVKLDTELSAADLADLVRRFKKLVKEKTGHDFPEDPFQQLVMARDAVFQSWMNQRAITYRKLNEIPDNLGTAVSVQAMVFGNMGNDCATGVGFTRNPSTGKDEFYGEYLTNAQGEDVVAGIRTPHPIKDLDKEMPRVFKELRQITTRLEKHYRDIQDFEFTIQQNKLYMLQTRTGKRTAQAAIKIAVDMVKEKLISKEAAILRIEPQQLDQLLHPIIDPKANPKVLAKGLPASPGAATGKVVFNADEAVKQTNEKHKVILVRVETCPDDIHGMHAAQGILTGRGGMTSHAAVVARGMGKCCIAGCETLKINEAAGKFSVGDITVKEGDWITLDGSTGQVFLGQVATIEPKLSGEFAEFMTWVDPLRKLKVRANADIPIDAQRARAFGAEGIGLCRTEHMFFAEDRIPIVQQMIMATSKEDRQKALAKLLPMQRSDFKGLFKAMKSLPVTIRLLDPPLHEFLPKREELMVEIAILKCKGGDKKEIEEKEKILQRVNALAEFNPMLGHRGCRLGITYPEITEMQARAIIEAACELKKAGIKVVPEIMVPLVGYVSELKGQKELIVATAKKVMEEKGTNIDYTVGTMIELPRAAVTADEIAKEADFFSFGTNDLTQTTSGLSRDDAGRFLVYYIEKGIIEKDPFITLDRDGVGQLIKIGVEKGRRTKKDLKIGICGEHGGDPDSVEFCHQVGLNYVSCSPFRVPIARLAAAQANLKSKKKSVAYSTK